MDMLDELKTLGIGIDEALESLGGNTALYTRLVLKLRDRVVDASAKISFEAAKLAETEEIVHALKGAAGALAFTPLYKGYSDALRLMREGQPGQAERVLKKLDPLKDDIISCINRHSV